MSLIPVPAGLCDCRHPLSLHIVLAWSDMPTLGGVLLCQELNICECVLTWTLPSVRALSSPLGPNWRPPRSLVAQWRQLLTAGEPFTISWAAAAAEPPGPGQGDWQPSSARTVSVW